MTTKAHAMLDSQQETNKKRRNLLVVPRTDVFGANENDDDDKNATTTPKKRMKKHETRMVGVGTKRNVGAVAPEEDSNNLVLLQLPSTDWTVQDLTRATFVLSSESTNNKPPTTNSTTTTTTTTTPSTSTTNLWSSPPAVSLVVEGPITSRTAGSFAVHKVETSNAWIVVPPSLSNQTTTTTTEPDQDASTDQPQENQDASSFVWVSRLWQQGKGAQFLELRTQTNTDSGISSGGCCWANLYHHLVTSKDDKVGWTVTDLARQLACTRAQVQVALTLLQQATGCLFVTQDEKQTEDDTGSSSSFTTLYGLWDPTLRRTIDTALLAALTEEESVSSLPTMTELLPWIRERLPSSLVSRNDTTTAKIESSMVQAVAPLYQPVQSPWYASTNHHKDHDGANQDDEESLEFGVGVLPAPCPGGGASVHVARLVYQSILVKYRKATTSHNNNNTKRTTSTSKIWTQDDLVTQWQLEYPGNHDPHPFFVGATTKDDQTHQEPTRLLVLYLQGLAVRVGASLQLDQPNDTHETTDDAPSSSTTGPHWMYFPIHIPVATTTPTTQETDTTNHNNNSNNKTNRDPVDQTMHDYFATTLCAVSSTPTGPNAMYHAIQQDDLLLHLKFLSNWMGSLQYSPTTLLQRYFVRSENDLESPEKNEETCYYAFQSPFTV